MPVQLVTGRPLFGSAGAIVTTFVVIPIVARMSKIDGEEEGLYPFTGHLHRWLCAALVFVHTRQTIHVHFCTALLLVWYRQSIHFDDVHDC
jgi:hypothetical protein